MFLDNLPEFTFRRRLAAIKLRPFQNVWMALLIVNAVALKAAFWSLGEQHTPGLLAQMAVFYGPVAVGMAYFFYVSVLVGSVSDYFDLAGFGIWIGCRVGMVSAPADIDRISVDVWQFQSLIAELLRRPNSPTRKASRSSSRPSRRSRGAQTFRFCCSAEFGSPTSGCT